MDAAGLAYVALTRLKREPGEQRAHAVVVNPCRDLDSFRERFERDVGPDEVPQLLGQRRLQ
jgi:hypothetical protein